MTEHEFWTAIRKAFKYPPITDEYVPLSIRHGSWRKRLEWCIQSWREAAALKLAPWLRRERTF